LFPYSGTFSRPRTSAVIHHGKGKQQMKTAWLIAALTLAGTQVAGAADVGLGVSVQSNDSWIYVPIDIGTKVRLEPSLRYFEGDSTSEVHQSFLGSQVQTTIKSESKTYELALGVFGLTDVLESVRIYYGARLAYVDTKSEVRMSEQFGNTVDRTLEETKSDGYRISPTLGFEYFLTKRFSLGGEAEWSYQDVDSEHSETAVPRAKADSKSSGTDTRLIARYRF
jgi:hypothetical protein